MKRAIGLIVMALPLCAQSVLIEDFKCGQVSSMTPGNPTTVTFTEPCGWEQGNARTLFTLGTIADGDTFTIGTTTWTMRTAINNSNANEILIGASNTDSVLNIVNAINDTGTGKGTTYSNATSQCSNCFAMNGFLLSSYSFWGCSKTTGNVNLATTKTGGFTAVTATTVLQSPLMVSGATGTWAGMGSDTTPKTYNNVLTSTGVGKYVSSTQITVPFNSTGLTWDGQTGIFIRGASAIDGNERRQLYQDEGWATYESPYTGGTWPINVPQCTDITDDAACSKGWIKPDNQKDYYTMGGATAVTPLAISSFVVSGPTITVTMAGLWTNAGAPFPDLAVGQLIWVRGFYAYSTATNPNSFPAQPAALALASASGGLGCLPSSLVGTTLSPGTTTSQTCRGFVVQTLTTINGGTQTQFTIKNPTDLSGGLQDGSYTSDCTDGHCPRSNAGGIIFITSPAPPYVYIANTRSNNYYQPGFGALGYAKGDISGAFLGTFTPSKFQIAVKYNLNADHDTSGTHNEIGTFCSTQSDQTAVDQAHWYHYLTPRIYSGAWAQMEINRVPTHVVGETGLGAWGVDPGNNNMSPAYSGVGAPYWTYWYGCGPFYIDGPGYRSAVAGISPVYKNAQFVQETSTPAELVTSRETVWAPSRYIGGVLSADAGYEVNWSSSHLDNLSYQVRYSTTGSLKTAGFSNGLCKSGTTTCDSSDTVVADAGLLAGGNYFYYWQSATLPAPSPTVWIAIRPTMPLTWAAAAGQDYWVGSDLDYSLTNGDHVTISINGDTQTNVATTALQPRQIWTALQPSTNNTWTGSGTLTSVVALSNTCTATTTIAHNLVPGWKIAVFGSSNSTLGAGQWWSLAKFYTVATTPSSTTFTFICTGVPDNTYNTDAGSQNHFAIMSLPGVKIAGTSPGYAANGTLIATDDTKNFTEITFTPPQDETPTTTSAKSGSARRGGSGSNSR